MYKYSIGKFSKLKGWQEVDFSDFSIKKPIVLGLNGNGGKDIETAMNLNQLIKSFLRDYEENEIDILTVAYSHGENDNFGSLQDDELIEIINGIFMPQLHNNGRRYDLQTAKKNMRKITVFTHCHGATILYRINEALSDRMELLGYSDDEISEILNQIFTVGFAPQNSDSRNSGLYIKSFDDEVTGKAYQEEIVTYNLVDLFESSIEKENIKDDRIIKAMTSPIKSSAIPYIGCGYPYRIKNMMHIYTQKLSMEGDHPLRNIRRDKYWRVATFPMATKHADIASLCIAEALRLSVENSKANFGDKFVKFNIENFESLCAYLIYKGNNSPEELANYLNYMSLNSSPRIETIMQDNGYTEQDLISGKITMDDIKAKAIGIIDFSETVYKRMIENARTAKAGYQYPNQRKPLKVYPIKDQYGIIWDNGDVSSCTDVNQILFATLHRKIFKNESIKNSVMFKLEEIDGKRSFYLADNFGSKDDAIARTFVELANAWSELYGFGKFSLNLTTEQKYAVENLKMKYSIGEDLNHETKAPTNICCM